LRGQGGRIGIDGRLRPVGDASSSLETFAAHYDAEEVLPKPQLVACFELVCGVRIS
jgi:hypothetical protein